MFVDAISRPDQGLCVAALERYDEVLAGFAHVIYAGNSTSISSSVDVGERSARKTSQ